MPAPVRQHLEGDASVGPPHFDTKVTCHPPRDLPEAAEGSKVLSAVRAHVDSRACEHDKPALHRLEMQRDVITIRSLNSGNSPIAPVSGSQEYGAPHAGTCSRCSCDSSSGWATK